jgi:hypothetical protein
MTNETTQAVFDIARLIAAGIVGVLIGSFLTHRFTLSRERQNREHDQKTAKEARARNFISFLDGLRTEAEWKAPSDFAKVFRDRMRELRSEAALIRGDVASNKQADFANCLAALCNMTDEDATQVEPDPNAKGIGFPGRNRVLAAIDAIKNFVTANG